METFEEIVEAHGTVVWRVCRSMLPASDADDAWSETFLSALQAYTNLPSGGNVRAWLVTIAYRKAIDQIRAASRRPDPSATLPEHSSCDSSRFEHDDLRASLRVLSDRQRRAVVYRHLGDVSYADLAELLGCSPAAARRSVADGIANIRKHFKQGETP